MSIQACSNSDMTFGSLLSTDGLLTFSLYTDWTTTAFAVWIGMFMLFYVFLDFCTFHFILNVTRTRNMSAIASIASCIFAIAIASSITSKVNSCTNESTATITEPTFDRLFYGSQIACNEISKSMSHVVTGILYVAFFTLLSRHWTDGLGSPAFQAVKASAKKGYRKIRGYRKTRGYQEVLTTPNDDYV